ncbi:MULTISPECIES: helix-turn-helix domain-containing protein [unclassified Nonomuraea]|uniref:helix-turn-helix domain-containing protein n=1 Tax=unclassified Nonomuraea TaxID=2593643 RepID=UPI0033FB54C4
MITARDLLNDPALAGHIIVGGQAGLDAVLRTAAFVHSHADLTNLPGGAAAVIDVSDDAGLSSQHLIEVFCRRLHGRGGRLLIVVGHRQTIADSTVRLANQFALPVIVLTPTPESSSAPALAARIMAIIQTPGIAHARALTTAAAKLAVSPSLPRVLAIVNDVLNGTSALVTADGVVTAGRLHWTSPETVTRQPAVTSERLQHHVWASCPIFHTDHMLWLACEARHGGPAWHEAARAILQIAAHTVAVQLLTQRLKAERDHHLLHNLFTELLHLDRHDRVPEHIVTRAATAGIPLDGWHQGIHFTWPNGTPTPEGDLFTEIATHLVNILATKHITKPLFTRADGWSLWQSWSARPTTQQENELLNRIQDATRSFNSAYPRYALVAGLGSSAIGPHAIALTLGQAHQAASAAAQRQPGTVETIDALGPQRLLSTWYADPAFREHARQLLAPVLAHPDADALLKTLSAYLDNGSSATATAKSTGMHRNTVSHRIMTIERLLGPLHESDRLTIHLACRSLGHGDHQPAASF